MNMPPSAAPPPPPYSAVEFGGLGGSLGLFGMLMTCLSGVLILVTVGCVCYLWCCNSTNQVRSDHDIERPLQRFQVAAPAPLVVLVSREYARKLDIEDCVICLESFEEGKTCWVLPRCGHGYHKSCITEWTARVRKCPICRSSIYLSRSAYS